MNLVQLAGALPRDPEFREWVETQTVYGELVSESEAAQFIRAGCGITSRRELATDTEAQARFHNLIRRPFVAWREQQKEIA